MKVRQPRPITCVLAQVQTRPPASVRVLELFFARQKKKKKKIASSVVEREQDGVKDSSSALLGSCTRGWRRRARSRRNYFLFSDPEREVDCLTSCSSRPRPCAHVCVRQPLRNIFCSDYTDSSSRTKQKLPDLQYSISPLMLHNHLVFVLRLSQY